MNPAPSPQPSSPSVESVSKGRARIGTVILWLCAGVLATVAAADESGQGNARSAPPVAPESKLVGAVEGVATFLGEIPKSTIADDAGVRRDLLEVDSKSRGLRGVVACLLPADASDRQHAALSAEQPIIVDQLDHAFTPRVVAARAGQPVTFTNSEPANHNVRTSSPIAANVFNVVTGVGGKYVHRFTAEAELRPIRLGCDIHPWMRGWIYVFDHPYFAVTDEAGRFRIGNVLPGRYKLILRQPDIRYASERLVSVSAGPDTVVEIEIRTSDAAKPE